MNCKKCGTVVPENSAFCPACGEAVEQNATQAATPAVEIKPLEGEETAAEKVEMPAPAVETPEAPVEAKEEVKEEAKVPFEGTISAPGPVPVTGLNENAAPEVAQPVDAPAAPTSEATPVSAPAPETVAQPVGYGVPTQNTEAPVSANPYGVVAPTPVVEAPKKKNSTILFIAIAVVLVAVIGVLVYLLIIKKDDAVAPAPKTTTTTTEEVEKTKKTTSTTQATIADTANTIKAGTLMTVELPDGYMGVFDEEEGQIQIADSVTRGKNFFMTVDLIDKGSVDSLAGKAEDLKAAIIAKYGDNEVQIGGGSIGDFTGTAVTFVYNGIRAIQYYAAYPNAPYEFMMTIAGTESVYSVDTLEKALRDIIFGMTVNTGENDSEFATGQKTLTIDQVKDPTLKQE